MSLQLNDNVAILEKVQGYGCHLLLNTFTSKTISESSAYRAKKIIPFSYGTKSNILANRGETDFRNLPSLHTHIFRPHKICKSVCNGFQSRIRFESITVMFTAMTWTLAGVVTLNRRTFTFQRNQNVLIKNKIRSVNPNSCLICTKIWYNKKEGKKTQTWHYSIFQGSNKSKITWNHLEAVLRYKSAFSKLR